MRGSGILWPVAGAGTGGAPVAGAGAGPVAGAGCRNTKRVYRGVDKVDEDDRDDEDNRHEAEVDKMY